MVVFIGGSFVHRQYLSFKIFLAIVLSGFSVPAEESYSIKNVIDVNRLPPSFFQNPPVCYPIAEKFPESGYVSEKGEEYLAKNVECSQLNILGPKYHAAGGGIHLNQKDGIIRGWQILESTPFVEHQVYDEVETWRCRIGISDPDGFPKSELYCFANCCQNSIATTEKPDFTPRPSVPEIVKQTTNGLSGEKTITLAQTESLMLINMATLRTQKGKYSDAIEKMWSLEPVMIEACASEMPANTSLQWVWQNLRDDGRVQVVHSDAVDGRSLQIGENYGEVCKIFSVRPGEMFMARVVLGEDPPGFFDHRLYVNWKPLP
jgi:hypothetical protein